MGELLEEAKVKFKKWHFKQTWKYTNVFNDAHEHIQQLEDKEEEEVINEKATQEQAK